MLEEKKNVEVEDAELEKTSGGKYAYPASQGFQYDGYNVVDWNWGRQCKQFGNDPIFSPYKHGMSCGDCDYYRRLPETINGWYGYCVWKKVDDE